MVLVLRSDIRETAVWAMVRLNAVQDAGGMIASIADYTRMFAKEGGDWR